MHGTEMGSEPRKTQSEVRIVVVLGIGDNEALRGDVGCPGGPVPHRKAQSSERRGPGPRPSPFPTFTLVRLNTASCITAYTKNVPVAVFFSQTATHCIGIHSNRGVGPLITEGMNYDLARHCTCNRGIRGQRYNFLGTAEAASAARRRRPIAPCPHIDNNRICSFVGKATHR